MMRNLNHGHGGPGLARAHQAFNQRLHVFTQGAVQPRERLVQNEKIRAHGQSAGQRNPLPHTAGQLARQQGSCPAKAHGFQHFKGVAPRFLLMRVTGQQDVLQGRAPGQKAWILKNKAHTPDSEVRGAFLRAQQARHNARQCGFSRAAGACKHHAPASLKRKIDLAQHPMGAKTMPDVTKPDQWGQWIQWNLSGQWIQGSLWSLWGQMLQWSLWGQRI